MKELETGLFVDIENNKIIFNNDYIKYKGQPLKDLIQSLSGFAEYNSDDEMDIKYAKTHKIKIHTNTKNKLNYELSIDIDLESEIAQLIENTDNVDTDYFFKELDYAIKNKHNMLLLEIAFILKKELDLVSNGVYLMRGSGIASYILYVLGLNKVNPIKFELDYKNFWEK